MTAPAFDIPGYTLVRELGAGGMATVYLAVQTSLDRRVAIKVMRRGMADENVEKRFLLEGRTMARLPHPNIVGVYDIVQNETINYIAMEFLDGGMLSDRMRQGLTLAEAVSVMVQIAGALQFAHDNGIVHRDLKPANIMFRDQHTPVLTDFGIARQSDATATRLTQTGMMIGTPTYMSPEQATGGDIDGRSDQYSLGVLFYEMLTGHPPFEGDSPIQVVLAHLNTPPPLLPAQFGFFQPLMDRLLAKSADQRFPDLRSFSRELRTLLTSNDALLNRLQTDPNQSASEQLRGLGFSESQINTGSARISGTSPIVTGQRAGPRTGQRTGSGPGVRMGPGPEPEPPSRPGWLLPAIGAAGVLLLAIAGWLMFGGSDDALDPALRNVVDSQLVTVDRLIADDKLVAPPGDNAYEKLQDLMQVAPNYPEAQRRLDGIVGTLREKAERALAANAFDVAETRVSEALAVAPRDAAVLALQKRIETGRLAMQNAARVRALLDAAEQARQAGRLSGEGSDNALALLRQAQEIDPGNADARSRLASLSGELLAPAKTALDAGRLDETRRLLDSSAAYLAGEPGWQALNSALEQAQTRLAAQKRIDELLAIAAKQLAAGRIAEPAGDNALDTLARVAELDPANADAARLGRDSGEALVRHAKAADAGGDTALALTRYDQALQAVPGQADWQRARQAIQQRLGERQTQLAAALANAREAIRDRRYFAPAGSSARDALDRALALDPADANAVRLAAELPTLAREAAQALADEGRLDDARALLAELTRRHPQDAEANRLATQLAGELERQRSAALREQRLDELRQLLAKRQLTAEIAKDVATALTELHKLDPSDAEAQRIRAGFLKGIGRAMASAERAEQLQVLDAALSQVEQQLGASSPDVAELRSAYGVLLADLQKQERARLAALAGTLVLNAQPWANVESVVEQASGQPVKLPSDGSTPLRLNVPPGTYRVTFRHPQIGQPVVRVVTLQAKGSQVANASFPTLNRAEYLKRAGYAQ